MEPVIHNGWLRKKGEGSLPFQRRWHRYWFLLRGPLLSWYTSPESSTEYGSLFLHHSQISVRKHDKYEGYFEINSTVPKLAGFANNSSSSSTTATSTPIQIRLLAPSIAALIEWLTIFERAVNRGIIHHCTIDKDYLNQRADIRQLASPLASPPVRRSRLSSVSDNASNRIPFDDDASFSTSSSFPPPHNTLRNQTNNPNTTTTTTNANGNQENEDTSLPSKGKKYNDSHRSTPNSIHSDRHIPQIIQHNDPTNIQNTVVINDDDIAEDMRIAKSVLDSGGLVRKKDLFQNHTVSMDNNGNGGSRDDSRRSSIRSTASTNTVGNHAGNPKYTNVANGEARNDNQEPILPILLLSCSSSTPSPDKQQQPPLRPTDDYLVVSPLPPSKPSSSSSSSMPPNTVGDNETMNESILRPQETSALDMTLPSPTLALRTTNVPIMPSLEEDTKDDDEEEEEEGEIVPTMDEATVPTEEIMEKEMANDTTSRDNDADDTEDSEDEELPSDYPLGLDVHAMGLPPSSTKPTVPKLVEEEPSSDHTKPEPSPSFVSPQITKRGKILRFGPRVHSLQLRTVPSNDEGTKRNTSTSVLLASPPSSSIFFPTRSTALPVTDTTVTDPPPLPESFIDPAPAEEEGKEHEGETESDSPLHTVPRPSGTVVDQSLYAHHDYPFISPVLQLHDATSNVIVSSPLPTASPVALTFTEPATIEPLTESNNNNAVIKDTKDKEDDTKSVPSLYESDTDSMGSVPPIIEIHPIVINPIVVTTTIDNPPMFPEDNNTMDGKKTNNGNMEPIARFGNDTDDINDEEDDVLNEALSPFAELEDDIDNNNNDTNTAAEVSAPHETCISSTATTMPITGTDNLASPTKELFKSEELPNETVHNNRTIMDETTNKSLSSPISALSVTEEPILLSPTHPTGISKADQTTSLSLNLSPPQNSIYINDDTVQTSSLSSPSTVTSPDTVPKPSTIISLSPVDTPKLDKPTVVNNPSELSFEEHLDALFDQTATTLPITNTDTVVLPVSTVTNDIPTLSSPEPVSHRTVRIITPESISSIPAVPIVTNEPSTLPMTIRTPVSTTPATVPFSYAPKTPFDDDVDLDNFDTANGKMNLNHLIVPSTPFDDMVSPPAKTIPLNDPVTSTVVHPATPNIVNVSSLNPFDSPVLTIHTSKELEPLPLTTEKVTSVPVFPSLESVATSVPAIPLNTENTIIPETVTVTAPLLSSPTVPTVAVTPTVPEPVTVPTPVPPPKPSVIEIDPVKKLQELLEITRNRVEALADRVRTEETDLSNMDIDTAALTAVQNASVVMDEALTTVNYVAQTPLILQPVLPSVPTTNNTNNDDIETIEMVLVVDSDALFDATPDFVLPSPTLPYNTLSPLPSPISTSKRVKRGKGTPGNKVRDEDKQDQNNSTIDYPSSVNNTIDSSLYSTNLDRLFSDSSANENEKKETTAPATVSIPVPPSVTAPVTTVNRSPNSVPLSSTSPVVTLQEFLEWGESSPVGSSTVSPAISPPLVPVPTASNTAAPFSPPVKSQLPLSSMDSPLSPLFRSQLPDEATVQAEHDAFSSDLNNWLKQFEQRLQSSFAKVPNPGTEENSKSVLPTTGKGDNKIPNPSMDSNLGKSRRSSGTNKVPDAGPAYKLNGSKATNGGQSQPSSRRSSMTGGSVTSQQSTNSNNSRRNLSGILDKSSGPLTSSNLNISSNGSNQEHAVPRGRTDSRRSSQILHNLPRSRSSSASVYSSHHPRSRSNSLTQSNLVNDSSLVKIPRSVSNTKLASKSAGPAPEMMKTKTSSGPLSSSSGSNGNVPGIRLSNSSLSNRNPSLHSRSGIPRNNGTKQFSVPLRSQSVGPHSSGLTKPMTHSTVPSALLISSSNDPMEDLMQSHANHLRRMLSRVKGNDNPIPVSRTTMENNTDTDDVDSDGQLSRYPSAASKVATVPAAVNNPSGTVIGKRVLYDNHSLGNSANAFNVSRSHLAGAGPVRRGTGTRVLTSPVSHNPWKGGVW